MKGLMLGIVMFNIYINHLEMGVNNMLTKFADDTKLKGTISMHNDKMDKWFWKSVCEQNDLLLKKSGEYNWYKHFLKESFYGRKSKASMMFRKNLTFVYRIFDFGYNVMELKTNTVFED